MSVDVVKQEINLKRLLEATEQIASTFVEEFAIEAAAASTYSEKRSVPYKSPYVITLFKKVRVFVCFLLEESQIG